MAAFFKDQKGEYHPIIQLIILFLLLFFFMIMGQVMALCIEGFIYHFIYKKDIYTFYQMLTHPDEENIMAIKLMQIISTIFQFIVTAFFFSFLVKRSPAFGEQQNTDFLKLKKPVKIGAIGIVIFIVLVSVPLVNEMGVINAKMSFPPFLSDFERYIKQMEEAIDKTISLMLKSKSISDLLLNIFMAGLLPALGEELIFRACIQQIFMKTFKSPHVAIFFAAILFSALHFQFYGFLPRFFLGYMFGYFFYWSGSIWLSATAHFFYNTFIILISGIPGKLPQELSADSPQNIPIVYVLASLVLLAYGIYAIFHTLRHERLAPNSLNSTKIQRNIET